MATSTAQRAGIWIIAVALIVGTLAGFIAMVLAPQNEMTSQTQTQELLAEYQAKVAAQTKEQSDKYYGEFSKYSTQPGAFTADGVTSVTTTDLMVGDGEEIKQDTKYSAYYIGWNPTGKVFDQSIEGGALKAPIAGGNLIEGWNEGVLGMRMGGVRMITIPSDKAYGEQGGGEDIPPNTPIRFIVMVIPTPDEIPVSKELQQAYGQ